MKNDNTENVISTKYGKLTIISIAATLKDGRARYNCLCDCGKKTTTRLKDMRSGKSSSCGCGKKGRPRNIKIGKRYGDVVVIELDTNKGEKKWNNGSSKIYWKCKCDCGTLFSVASQSLKDNGGGIKSCGCSMKGRTNRPPNVDAPFRHVFHSYKTSGNARYKKDGEDFKFNLLFDDAVRFFSGNCYYCGIEPSRMAPIIGKTEKVKFNGIDRVDSLKGYSVDNCVSCCTECNLAKSDRSQENFLNWAKRLSFHQQEKQISNNQLNNNLNGDIFYIEKHNSIDPEEIS